MITLTPLTSGDLVGQIGFADATAGDAISNELAREIIRRLRVFVPSPKGSTSDIWDGQQPPEDKSIYWWPKDPVTGARLGQPRKYDEESDQWIEQTGEVNQVQTPTRKRRNGYRQFPSGGSHVNLEYDDMGTTNLMVTITWVSLVDGEYLADPTDFEELRYCITGIGSTSVSIKVGGVPVSGIGMIWEVAEKAGTEDQVSE